MFTNSYFSMQLGRERQRDMLARAERQRLVRQGRAQSRKAEPGEPLRWRIRGALRAAFA
jgi:hypothetical protein